MILDQDIDCLILTENFLKNHSFHKIYSFSNPIQALQRVYLFGPPDLIITDLKLPDMSGIDFLAKAARIDKSINAIIFTGYPEALPRRCCHPVIIKEAGSYKHLMKMVMSILA